MLNTKCGEKCSLFHLPQFCKLDSEKIKGFIKMFKKKLEIGPKRIPIFFFFWIGIKIRIFQRVRSNMNKKCALKLSNY